MTIETVYHVLEKSHFFYGTYHMIHDGWHWIIPVTWKLIKRYGGK